MEKAFKKVRRQFTLVTVTVAIFCASIATIGTYFLAERALQQKISAAKIGELAAGNSELSTYIANQEPNHAHFETIATIIQGEDRRLLGSSLPYVLSGVFVISGFLGWWLSRKLIKPVEESYKSQRRFMQDAAHELRNPLAAMGSIVQQAKNNPPTGKKLDEFVDSINRQSDHLSAITTDLLLLEHRDFPGNDRINASALLNDVIEELHHLTLQNNVKIDLKSPKDMFITFDSQHFVYIAKNMIENAIKFSPKNGRPIEIVLKNNKNSWSLKVKDYGIGIPTEDIPNITKRFYRAKNATTTEGTGLGMAIVSKFVDIYNGSLDINSRVGKGTTISVSM